MRYTLSIDGKRIGVGSLSVNEKQSARFWAGDGEKGDALLGAMERVRLECVAANGIGLSGFMLVGKEKNGDMKFRHAEWWLAYENGGSSVGALASVCRELVDAMRAYEQDVDDSPTDRHREMMERARAVLRENGGGA